jgi:hypothetical protein
MSDAIICAPMRIEARAIRRGLRTSADPPEYCARATAPRGRLTVRVS